jgi:thiol:disulfide interchange protein DsbD
MTKRFYLSLATLLVALTAWAQMADPVHFRSELKMLQGDEAEIVFTATIDPGWHVYSTDITDDGPTKATFHAERLEGAELVGALKPRGQVKEQFDEMFGTNLRFFENQGAFVQKIRFTKPQYDISAYLEYGACNDEMCMPPTTVEFAKKGNSPVGDTPPSAPEGATIVLLIQFILAQSQNGIPCAAQRLLLA